MLRWFHGPGTRPFAQKWRDFEQSSGWSGEAENTGQASLFHRTLLRTPRKWPWPVAVLPGGEIRGRGEASQTRAVRLPRSGPACPAAQPQMPGLSGESVHMCFIPPGPDCFSCWTVHLSLLIISHVHPLYII